MTDSKRHSPALLRRMPPYSSNPALKRQCNLAGSPGFPACGRTENRISCADIGLFYKTVPQYCVL